MLEQEPMKENMDRNSQASGTYVAIHNEYWL